MTNNSLICSATEAKWFFFFHFASRFNFAEILDIELSIEVYTIAADIVNKIPGLRGKMKIVNGSLIHYFPADAFVF